MEFDNEVKSKIWFGIMIYEIISVVSKVICLWYGDFEELPWLIASLIFVLLDYFMYKHYKNLE